MPHADISRSVRLGALGWSDPAWRGTFYPADMPDEWRLTYFNTQFNCVFLAQADWRRASSDQLAQWNADTHEQFVFLLEGEAAQPAPEALAGKALLMRPDDPAILWFTRNSSLKQLAGALSENAVAMPHFLVSRDGDLGQMERVATLLEVMGR
ncbi:MAG: hypothetical protein B7Y41_15430 [Hydrogenophilales bacterium 28-61-23]|nr:MAG: hypothetical protein B7Y41_15430 [Hydrogenophilales bacterium 28-61-23]